MVADKVEIKFPVAKMRRLEKAIGPEQMDTVIDKHLLRGAKLIGKAAESEIRQGIRSGSFEKNADLTIMIKGSSKPLVDRGSGIFQGISSHEVDGHTVFVGILRTDEEYNIALALHEGVSISVTPAMRGLFFYLWQASEGKIDPSELTGRAAELWERQQGGWKPLKTDTTHIRIPSRPFIADAVQSPKLKRRARAIWAKALKDAMREMKNQV